VIQLQKSLNNQSIDNGTHLPALTKPGSVCFGCLFAARFNGRGSYFYLIYGFGLTVPPSPNKSTMKINTQISSKVASKQIDTVINQN
jgi:hypothetical protein